MVKRFFGLVFRVLKKVLAWGIWTALLVGGICCVCLPEAMRRQVPLFVPIFAFLLCIAGIGYHIFRRRNR